MSESRVVRHLKKKVDKLTTRCDANATAITHLESVVGELRHLQNDVRILCEQKAPPPVIVKGAVWSDFTEQFWKKSHFLWKDGKVMNKKGEEIDDFDFTMPLDCEEILREMGAMRKCTVVDKDSGSSAGTHKRRSKGVGGSGRSEQVKYYQLFFREGGRIPHNWSNYMSYKFAVKVGLYMSLPEHQRWNTNNMGATYKMFSSSRECLTGRLRMLMRYAYTLAKFTWSRTFAVDCDGGRGLSPLQLMDKQPEVLRSIAKRAAKECRLFDRDLYSEEDARYALSAVLKSHKDTDTYIAPLHSLAHPDFEKKKRRLFLTARISAPFAETARHRAKRRQEEHEGEEETRAVELEKTVGMGKRGTKRKRNTKGEKGATHQNKDSEGDADALSDKPPLPSAGKRGRMKEKKEVDNLNKAPNIASEGSMGDEMENVREKKKADEIKRKATEKERKAAEKERKAAEKQKKQTKIDNHQNGGTSQLDEGSPEDNLDAFLTMTEDNFTVT